MTSKIHPTAFIHPLADVEPGVEIGANTKVWRWAHIMSGCKIGKDCMIGQGCSIASKVTIGDSCRIQNGSHLFDGCVLGTNVFLGPNVITTNVKFPRSHRKGKFEETIFRDNCSVGANSTIICGIEIGVFAMIGAGSVVTKNIPSGVTAFGVPAIIKKSRTHHLEKLNI